MPAATRPVWKGQLRLSLVSIPVEMYTTTKSAGKPSFRHTEIEEPQRRPREDNVVDLMAALKKSLEGGEKAPAKKPAAGKPATRTASASKSAAKAPVRRKAS